MRYYKPRRRSFTKGYSNGRYLFTPRIYTRYYVSWRFKRDGKRRLFTRDW